MDGSSETPEPEQVVFTLDALGRLATASGWTVQRHEGRDLVLEIPGDARPVCVAVRWVQTQDHLTIGGQMLVAPCTGDVAEARRLAETVNQANRSLALGAFIWLSDGRVVFRVALPTPNLTFGVVSATIAYTVRALTNFRGVFQPFTPSSTAPSSTAPSSSAPSSPADPVESTPWWAEP